MLAGEENERGWTTSPRVLKDISARVFSNELPPLFKSGDTLHLVYVLENGKVGTQHPVKILEPSTQVLFGLDIASFTTQYPKKLKGKTFARMEIHTKEVPEDKEAPVKTRVAWFSYFGVGVKVPSEATYYEDGELTVRLI